MPDEYAAIEAKMKIFYLKQKCEEECNALQKIIDKNLTLENMKAPWKVVVDTNKLSDLHIHLEEASYVGHNLVYKDYKVGLHTSINKRPEEKIFERLFSGEKNNID